jgi:hypothetical protein
VSACPACLPFSATAFFLSPTLGLTSYRLLHRIDTPGVIQRVSRLFHGNPPLIQGFNTFLPVGYRIDVSDNPLDNTITVTTPMGTTTQSTTNPIPRALPQQRDIPGFGPNIVQPFGYHAIGSPSILPPHAAGSLSRSMTPQQALQLGHVPVPYDQPFSPGFQQNPQTTAAASLLGNLNNRNTVEKQQQEFNHAIQYLNKIKARYSDDTNTYKQFLDILQTYQKEQRHLQDVSSWIMRDFFTRLINILYTSPRFMFKCNNCSKTPPIFLLNSKIFCQTLWVATMSKLAPQCCSQQVVLLQVVLIRSHGNNPILPYLAHQTKAPQRFHRP